MRPHKGHGFGLTIVEFLAFGQLGMKEGILIVVPILSIIVVSISFSSPSMP